MMLRMFKRAQLRTVSLSLSAAHRVLWRSYATPLRIAVVGLPHEGSQAVEQGGGKGTQCAMAEKDFDLVPISTGNLLRDIIRGEGEYEQDLVDEISELIKNGQLVSDDLMVKVVREALTSTAAVKQGWVLDGFPRSTSQASALDRMLKDIKQELAQVLYIDVPEEEIVNRVAGRRIHEASGRVYNIHSSPPKVDGKDDVTGEPLTQRPDDEPETVRQRIDKYKEQTVPVLDYYRARGMVTDVPSPTSKEGYSFMKKYLLSLQ